MSEQVRNVTVSLSSEMVDWIDEFLGTQREYRSRSHLVEEACHQLLLEEGFIEDEPDDEEDE